jgi:general secretion pathway protein D
MVEIDIMTFEREIRLAGAMGLLSLCVACNPANEAYREGRKAEARKDYDSAVIYFGKALQEQPENSQYMLHERLARQSAASFHFEKGRRLMAEKRFSEAAAEFQKAVSVDPSNEAAAEELAKVVAMEAAIKSEREKAIRQAMKQQEEIATPNVVKLKTFPQEPLAHFRLTADSRKVFETLGKLAELNMAFSHDFQPRPLSLDLTNVRLEDALHIAALSANVFWKVVTPNTILIIPDSPANRREYEEEVLRTFHLGNPLAPADRTAISTALKQVLGLQKVIDNPESNSIIIRDTPERVAAAEELIHSLDLAKGEVLVEVSIMEASVDRVRNLGLAPLSPQPPAIAALLFTPPATTTESGGVTTTTTSQGLPLNQLGKLSSSDFSIVLPNVVADALLSDARAHVLQQPQVRATDGQTAKLRIGQRIPYATGSFLPSFGGTVSTGTTTGSATTGLLASTQFQYQDIGVNLDITPHITATGEVGLHAVIEILNQAGTSTIGGLSEPIFGQRKVEQDIRLREGESTVLGGLIEHDDNKSISGLPFLADIPGVRYFFSTEEKTQMETEILIMLTPHIVRLPEIREAASNTPVAKETLGPGPRPFALPEGAPPQPPQPPQPQQ